MTLDAFCFEPLFRFGRTAMRQFAEAENAWTRLVMIDRELAGFIIVHMEDAPATQVGYLVTIDVAREYRRQGIGELMLAAAEAWLSAASATAIMLHVYVKNYDAISFYERNGYKRGDEQQQGFYAPGMDAALYWKRLPRQSAA